MIALMLCAVAFIACYWAGRRSLGQGLVALLFFGYFYGILRANLLTTFSHFIFDAGMLGLYLAAFLAPSSAMEQKRSGPVLRWVICLVGWPMLLLLMPFQPLLVSLVGFRGNVYFLPLLLIGCRLKGKDLIELSTGLAVLDLVAVAFGGAEYFLGLMRFYPVSPVTEIIYASGDVAGGFYRIPAIFTHAHAFGGTMVATLPFLVGLWGVAQKRILKLLALVSIPVALLGVLMSATRMNFVIGSVIDSVRNLYHEPEEQPQVVFLLIIAFDGFAALRNERFQRFKSLSDTDSVSDRVAGSVNRGFFEILLEYPMGNGLAGAAPAFLIFCKTRSRIPSEWKTNTRASSASRALSAFSCGSGFWAGSFSEPASPSRPAAGRLPETDLGLTAIAFGTAWIGTGLLTSIPGTVLIVIGLGWTSLPQLQERLPASRRLRWPALRPGTFNVPALR